MAVLTIMCVIVPVVAMAGDGEEERKRVKQAGTVMTEIMNSFRAIPIRVLNKAECVIVIPSIKKASVAKYRRGVMTCRGGEQFTGPWSAPTMMKSGGESVGLQAGGQSIDLVILVMNDKGARAAMKGGAKLGADPSVAAGPVGLDIGAFRNAMSAEMLSYSRTEGVLGGLSLSGTTLGPDEGANKKLYGKKVTPTEIISGAAGPPPASAQELRLILTLRSPQNDSRGK